jgi:glucose/arabinose dehydrogenase
MKTVHARVATCAALLLSCLSFPVFGAIQLVPVVSSGIASPVFVGNAADGTNRLFIVERAGTIRVLQPGSSSPTLFLDIRSKIVSGGEQGLLGLAFHPLYSTNGRFFVYYTQAADGTLVIAEYKVAASNKDVADPTEKVILTIPHPTNTNHNGGMLAFGPDGFLYIGVGDGGSANDPPNNAQNVNVLLGKILRIDINPPQASGAQYVSPSTNPFFGTTAGRDEIFALGIRNPWRFSFDRLTGQLWVADVGQGAREEVDTPILSGGNYGWRVYEGFACTNNDQALCNAANYTLPIFDYAHANGRCSITGGYVYRGSSGALPAGTYVYGDYCSGEIFSWDGSTQTVLLDTTQNIASFGEDEQGELYVVNLGGTLSKIVPTVPCTYSVSLSSAAFQQAGDTGSVVVTADAGCTWTAVSNDSWITVTGGTRGSGNGTVTYSVAPYTGRPRNRNGTMTIAGKTVSIKQSR